MKQLDLSDAQCDPLRDAAPVVSNDGQSDIDGRTR
jgi:hypothetical protein